MYFVALSKCIHTFVPQIMRMSVSYDLTGLETSLKGQLFDHSAIYTCIGTVDLRGQKGNYWQVKEITLNCVYS